MNELPLPKGGRIRNIIHISDTHIRTGDIDNSRYEEYLFVIKELCCEIRMREREYVNETVVILTGDVFHHKNKLESSGLFLFTYLIQNICDICPLYIIQGNHDFRQDQPETLDILSAFFECYKDKENVFFLNKTGLYVAGDVGFGLVSIKDTLISGDTFGRVKDLPKFPNAKNFTMKVRYKIALFHGSISDDTKNQTIFENMYPLSWFKGYNYGLFGDIHKQQIHYNEKLDLKWGYSGSLVQQNYGENLFNHGYLLWNLEKESVKEYHIKNKNGYGKVKYDYILDNWDIQHNQEWIDLDNFLHENGCINPSNIKVRIIGEVSMDEIMKLKECFSKHEMIGDFTSMLHISKGLKTTKKGKELNQSISEDTNTLKIANVLTDDKYWSEFCDANCNNVNANLISFDGNSLCNLSEINKLTNNLGVYLLIKQDGVHQGIFEKLEKKNKEINIGIDKFQKIFDEEENKKYKENLELKYLQFQNILCYGEECHFDFERLKGNVGILSASNGYGKSSFLETICLSLFGECIESRYNKGSSASILCASSSLGASQSYTIIQFKLGKKTYQLYRTFNRQKIDHHRIQMKTVELREIDEEEGIIKGEGEEYPLLHSGNSSVETWINKRVGSCSDFLLSYMITQNQDCDFLSKKSSDQIDIIDRSINFESVRSLLVLLNTCSNGYKYMNDHFDTILNTEILEMKSTNEKEHNELKEEIQNKENKLKEISSMIDLTQIIRMPIQKGGDETLINLESKTFEEIKEISEGMESSFYSFHDKLDETAKIMLKNINYQDILNRNLIKKGELEYKLSEYKESVGNKKHDEYLKEPENDKSQIDIWSNRIKRLKKPEKININYQDSDIHDYIERLKELNLKTFVFDNSYFQEFNGIMENENILDRLKLIVTRECEKYNVKEIKRKYYDNLKNFLRKNLKESIYILKEVEILKELEELEGLEEIYIGELSIYNSDKESGNLRPYLNETQINEELKELEEKIKNTRDENLDIIGSQIKRKDNNLESRNININKLNTIKKDLEENQQELEDKLKYLNESMNEGNVKYSFSMNELRNCESAVILHENNYCLLDKKESDSTILKDFLGKIDVMNQELESNINDKSQIEKIITDLTKSVELIPYNKECPACQKQPSRIQLIHLKQKKIEYEEKIIILKEKIRIHIGRKKVYNKRELYNNISKWIFDFKNNEENHNEKKEKLNILKKMLKENDQKKELEEENEDYKLRINDIKKKYIKEVEEISLEKDEVILLNKRYERIKNLIDKKEDMIKREEILRKMKKDWKDYKKKKCVEDIQELRGEYNKLKLIEEMKGCLKSLKCVCESKYYIETEEKNTSLRNRINILQRDWDIWDRNECQKIKDELNLLNKEVSNYENYKIQKDEYIYWSELLLVKEEYDDKQKYEKEKKEILKLLDELKKKEIYEEILNKQIAQSYKKLKDISQLNDFVKNKKESIDILIYRLKMFRRWIYDEKILPKICNITNEILETMGGESFLKIHAVFKSELGEEFGKSPKIEKHISWYMIDRNNKIYIEKASGYQRFILGLALRISLSYIGASGIMCRQLFIDEGFTACDSKHLERVPLFIQNMLSKYDTILLMSHMDVIQNCVDQTIYIKRIGDVSQIQYGDCKNIDTKKKKPRK
jgi:DNA repair exonuclease SbcCD ATPase subunit/DNA repair exonuclease SbcCD nuclease subunit